MKVSAKQVETLNYYDMFNNLENQKNFLEKVILTLKYIRIRFFELT